MTERFSIRQYLRGIELPFCPGCGDLTILNCFLRAVRNLGYEDLKKFAFCSGIGCAAWIPSPFLKADTIHATHGRSIPIATGVKLTRPDLNVVVFGGDGDIAGIGLGHLIHAIRRNLDITVIMANNMIYGMTGGQTAPTTPVGVKTTTAPYGNFEHPIDVTRLVIASGSSYVARWTTFHVKELRESIERGINTKGFAFIEVISQCPTVYGKRIGLTTAIEMVRWFKENSIELEKYPEEENIDRDKFVVGEFVHREFPTLTENIQQIIREMRENGRTE